MVVSVNHFISIAGAQRIHGFVGCINEKPAPALELPQTLLLTHRTHAKLHHECGEQGFGYLAGQIVEVRPEIGGLSAMMMSLMCSGMNCRRSEKYS